MISRLQAWCRDKPRVKQTPPSIAYAGSLKQAAFHACDMHSGMEMRPVNELAWVRQLESWGSNLWVHFVFILLEPPLPLHSISVFLIISTFTPSLVFTPLLSSLFSCPTRPFQYSPATSLLIFISPCSLTLFLLSYSV